MRRPGLKGGSRAHGSYIYAYCHVRTNQVVYSFTQVLHNSRALKQLPDLGANNKDAVLRRDMWKPLFTLCLPAGDDGRSQGIAAFQKLREWRMLHELNWEMPDSMKMPHTQEHLDEVFKVRLEDRGGSKAEHPHDLAKRAKKRARVRLIQDQKANSIADLAAVLLEQEDRGEIMTKWKAATNAMDRAKEIEEMRNLAEQVKNHGIEKIEAQLSDFEERLRRVLAGEEDSEGFKRIRLRREIQSLQLKQVRMEFAFRAVMRVEREAQGVKVHVPEASGQEHASASPEQSRDDRDLAAASTDIDWASKLPSFPERLKESVPERGENKKKERRLKAPIFSTEGVKVRWQNIFDAAFAEKWPSNVQHERMGWTRFTAPKGLAAPVDDFAEHTVPQRRRSKQHDPSGARSSTVAADEEQVGKIEEGDSGAEREEASEAEVEQRDAAFHLAKSKILQRVGELAQKELGDEARKQRYAKYVAKAERRGEAVKSMEERYWRSSQKAKGPEPAGEQSQLNGENVQV